MTASIAVLATLDTKLEETRYLVDRIVGFGGTPLVVNTGTSAVDDPLSDVDPETLRALAVDGEVDADTEKLRRMQATVSGGSIYLSGLIASGEVSAVVAIGGGQGSWLASGILRSLPVGFPRLLVSTAGRDVGQYTQFSDIVNVFSITDVAGTNPLLRRVLGNAAAAVTGMAQNADWRDPLPAGLVALSVYGITTPGAKVVIDELENRGIEPVSFHANGVGGPTMEHQIASGTFTAVLDWSITEVADEVVGGICTAGPERLTHAPRLGLPQVIVPGGVDVVNFAAPSTMPARFDGRLYYAHTPEATLLRTSAAENVEIAGLVAERLNATSAPTIVIVPLGGFSALSAADGPLHDPEADLAFAEAIERAVDNPNIIVERRPEAINDPAFARYVAGRFAELITP